jgi:hypothetical protein
MVVSTTMALFRAGEDTIHRPLEEVRNLCPSPRRPGQFSSDLITGPRNQVNIKPLIQPDKFSATILIPWRHASSKVLFEDYHPHFLATGK